MKIREWLADPSDYNIGVGLYLKYGSHNNFKKILQRGGDTPKNRSSLIYELQKISGKDEVVVSITTNENPVAVQTIIPDQIEYQDEETGTGEKKNSSLFQRLQNLLSFRRS